MEGTAQAYGRFRRRNLPRAVKRGQASRPIRRGAKPSPPPSHNILSGTGAFYSPINGRERGREGLAACQTVLNEDMSSFQVCFQGLVMTMHPRKTTTSSVEVTAAFNIFVASGRPYRPRPTGGNTPAGKDGRSSYRKKGWGSFFTQTASPRRAGYPGEG
jgi:hypothetical protein